MAGLIVSPVIDLVKQKVVAYLEDRIELHLGVEEKLKKLEGVLNRIQPVANTAEEVDLEKHKDLKPWMTDLKVTVEEAKDVLDEFEYLRLKRRAEGEGVDHQVRSSPKRLKGFAGRVFIPSSLYNYAKKIIPSTDPLERLSSIQSKLEGLDSRAVQFLLVVADRKATDRELHNQDVRKRETSSSVGERELVGRKDLLEGIISKLLEEEEEEEEHISVLPVVGHGGMGKTTVAQHVFNDTRVAARFQVRMWAHVSQIFDVSTLTKKMIESATPTERCVDTDSLETLQQKLKDVLKSNRFLLVLDDLWYGQKRYAMEEEWNKLCSPLAEAGGKGSKILLTSRTPEVKELSGALTTIISLQGLTKEECWSIMQRSAFRGNGIPSRDLAEIGRQIALKVQGSPLAAKVVGGILRKELSWRYWSSILKTELSNLPGNDMMPVLRLSYHYLPPHLRQCFAYCSLFPKGHIFNVDKLVRMWVAHGYIRGHLPHGEMTEEDMGKSYFHDLLSAGFFTRQIDVDESYVVMHDLMNDLARFVTKDEIVRIEEDTHGYIPKTVRHLSVRTDYLAELTKNNCNFRELESFLLFRRGRDYVDLDDKLVAEVLKQLRSVRVLDLNWCKVKELPDDISDWIHLRYLDLSYTQICRLPDSLWRLYHLQVLSIVDDYESRPLEICSLEKLNNLVKLRFVGINQLVKLTEEGRGSQIQNLKALNDLGVSLYPYGIHYIESGAAAREAYLCRKKRLQQLYLQWWEHCSSDVAQTEVLEGRQPPTPTSIERLDINGYAGTVWPNWMSIPSLENLHSIELCNLFYSDCLPPLGQLPFLQSLHLESLPRVRKLSQEGFPSLNTLVIRYMDELEEWSGPDGSGGLPCLRVFKIVKCPKLRVLPALSHKVTNLEIEAVGIYSLPELIVDQEIAHSGSSSSSIISFSSELSELWIGACGNLTSLGKGLLQNQERLNHLKKVTIGRCELLVSIPDGGFRELNSLEYLEIYYCPNLTWAAPSKDVDHRLLPSSLEELTISHIGDEALSRCLPDLTNLSKLTIVWCPYLKQILLPEEHAYLTSLQELCIYFCEALKTSGLEGLQALHSLKVLRINNCPGLLVDTSLISAADDREGMVIGPFPLALEGLEIDDPLMLVNVPVLKSLTTVQEVNIKDASRLISFSLELEEWLLQNGTFLKKLIIHKAQHLLSLPNLPNSVEKLYIVNANQEFKNKYERDTGCDWYKIRHVKYIAID